ncbi:MAG: DPP IV N-terminal domain-containing protein [Rhizomicrobium sp.]
MAGCGASADPERYRMAERLLPDRLAGTVRNDQLSFHWLADQDRLWYRRDTEEGWEFVLADPASGAREPAFDHSAVAQALATFLGRAIQPSRISATRLAFGPGASTVVLHLVDAIVTFDREKGAVLDLRRPPDRRGLLVSPDERRAVFRREENLWLKDLRTGEERALTDDGLPYFSYGKLPDYSMMTVLARNARMSLPPVGAAWSPSARYVVAPRLDERALREYPIMQVGRVPGGAPLAHTIRRPVLGDRGDLFASLFVFDFATGEKREVVPPPGWPELSHAALTNSAVDSGTWSSDETTLYVVWGTNWSRRAGLIAIDIGTGRARVVIEETAQTHLDLNLSLANAANVRVLRDGAEVVWFSERDGWGHLYLYDGTTGEMKRQLTKGPWAVFDIIHVDEPGRRLIFSAGGREGGDPYQRRVYRVSLDGGEPVLLTPEAADHMIPGRSAMALAMIFGATTPPSAVSWSGRLFVDVYSTLDEPTVSVVRSLTDGGVQYQLERADASALWQTGYRPPEPFVAKAADGETDIYGVVYWPPDAGGEEKFPVIDALYGGPQNAVTPHNFRAYAARNLFGPAALSQLGFVVVTLDARSTAMRSKAFHDYGYANFGDGGLADHVAFIRQLGERHPCIDTGRVGVYGFSFGGYFSARAMLRHGDFYKVAVSMAGSHDYHGLYPMLSKHHGRPVYADGSAIRPDDSAIPDNYRELNNSTFAADLSGRLLLIAGDLDENAPLAVTLQFTESLIKANKTFDLLVMPGHDHYSMVGHPYVVHRLWDYFVEHLRCEKPPPW